MMNLEKKYDIALSFLMGVEEVDEIAKCKSRVDIEFVMMKYLRDRDKNLISLATSKLE